MIDLMGIDVPDFREMCRFHALSSDNLKCCLRLQMKCEKNSHLKLVEKCLNKRLTISNNQLPIGG
ncbi:hypothetical protein KIN12_07820, partial [Vibrio cholerae]|nr:hypothetical protein [Vibrio cholerae]